jgi:hypothetical protein
MGFSVEKVTPAVVTLQHDGIRGRRGGREGGAPVFITVKRFDNKAQGRREGGAPWGQRQQVRGLFPVYLETGGLLDHKRRHLCCL